MELPENIDGPHLSNRLAARREGRRSRNSSHQEPEVFRVGQMGAARKTGGGNVCSNPSGRSSYMQRATLSLLFLGVMASMTLAQQPPPPPPPPPPAAASQPGAQAASPENSQQQQSQSPVQQNSVQQNSVQQNPVPQSAPQQTPAQQSPQHNPTEPTVPAPQQQSGAQQANNLPEADRIEAEKETEAIREKADSRLRDSRAVLKELLGGKAGIPNTLIQQAKCVIVIPSVKKIASAVGVKYGRGVMVCRLGEDFNGPWSPPAMYALEGGNFGFQIGL